MIEIDFDAADELWAAYLAAQDESSDEETPVVEVFGDSREFADQLLSYVTRGVKRASSALVAEYDADGETLPRISSHWIACDGLGHPTLVIRTVELRLGPLTSVDEAFAKDDREQDHTVESWLRRHRKYFRRTCRNLDIEFSDDLEVLFERFRVVWPPEHAD